jgi:hypothetical protein
MQSRFGIIIVFIVSSFPKNVTVPRRSRIRGGPSSETPRERKCLVAKPGKDTHHLMAAKSPPPSDETHLFPKH